MYTIENSHISILVNYKKEDHHDINWAAVKKRYEALMPNAEICIGSYQEGEYSKSMVINNAAKRATGDTFIIVDSNIVFNLDTINKGLNLLNQYSFIIPYDTLIYLNHQSTQYFHSLSPSAMINNAYFNAYKRDIGRMGDMFMVTREHFEAVDGFSEHITEWGEDNIDFADRLYNKYGDHKVVHGPIWNLYYEKINYPVYIKGINVNKIMSSRYAIQDISWDVRI
ncbi:hypothetical protein HZI73_14735 [Vallitalea pronyensis]|uniref:Galactosyltransferase C-terminal domain-containing protein n=1 Tax=Vallitalea pronyensis TaxID=1348613 RepID=A0A8J8MLF6_9FIRM|nr:galactosyltransferase-related protein [Vallitalea pronyensis]QUI23463.1 hypothetical protein HZI73_14735 [Vallitalea pronyensis]